MNNRDIVIGRFYWCDTARSNIGMHFSDKSHRPVLVISTSGIYAAVYPCTSGQYDIRSGEWVGDIMGSGDTYVIHSMGLFYVPQADLQLPGKDWSLWPTYRKAHFVAIQEDLRRFKHLHRHRLQDRGEQTQASRLGASIADLMPAELLHKLTKAPPPQPPPRRPPPPPPPKISPEEEFRRAFDSIMPYHILDKNDTDDED